MGSDSLSPTTQTVLISVHAVEQYRHRVRPGLDQNAARTELERLCATGESSDVAPVWLEPAKRAPYYLLLGDDVALPLFAQWDRWIATALVAQGTLTPTRRAEKSTRSRRSLGASRRARRRTPL